jgi:uncharacterized protein YegP (UPF0339 family)
MNDAFEVFKGSDDQWYFRRVAGNGEIVSVSEGHANKIDASHEAAREGDGAIPVFVMVDDKRVPVAES